MQAIARQVEIRRMLSGVQMTENIVNPPHLIGSDFAGVTFEELL